MVLPIHLYGPALKVLTVPRDDIQGQDPDLAPDPHPLSASLLSRSCSLRRKYSVRLVPGAPRAVPDACQHYRARPRRILSRGLAARRSQGLSVSSVQRIWRAHGLPPHHVRQFKLSNDPKFVEKLRDVVGLYVSPPAHAIMLSFDEKSQIQALNRSQTGLPLKKGRAGTMTHDYKRNGPNAAPSVKPDPLG